MKINIELTYNVKPLFSGSRIDCNGYIIHKDSSMEGDFSKIPTFAWEEYADKDQILDDFAELSNELDILERAKNNLNNESQFLDLSSLDTISVIDYDPIDEGAGKGTYIYRDICKNVEIPDSLFDSLDKQLHSLIGEKATYTCQREETDYPVYDDYAYEYCRYSLEIGTGTLSWHYTLEATLTNVKIIKIEE